MTAEGIDYGKGGYSIQAAILDHARQYPDKASRPRSIRWNGLNVATADFVTVPREGRVRAESLSVKASIESKASM